ncbi:MAG: hypothetical protein V1856_01750 [Candidatus Liptonbacteria bacterium]
MHLVASILPAFDELARMVTALDARRADAITARDGEALAKLEESLKAARDLRNEVLHLAALLREFDGRLLEELAREVRV